MTTKPITNMNVENSKGGTVPTIAEKLETLREHYGNHNRLAVELGWSPIDVQDWLTGDSSPSNGAQDAINRLYAELVKEE